MNRDAAAWSERRGETAAENRKFAIDADVRPGFDQVDGVRASADDGLPKLVDEDEAEHRIRASQEHRRRLFRQIRSGALIIVLAAAAVPFWHVAYYVAGLDEAVMGSLAGYELNIAKALVSANGAPKAILIGLFVVGPLLMVIVLIGYSYWYLHERDRDWRVAEAQADAREPKESAFGYMRIFRLYARTKRRAIFMVLYGLLALWWAGLGVWTYFSTGVGASSFLAYALLAQAVVLAPLAIWILVLAFDVSRRFVPGRIMVTKTLIMSTLATTSQTDYAVAQAAANEIEKDLRHEKPWWFYSYRKASNRYV